MKTPITITVNLHHGEDVNPEDVLTNVLKDVVPDYEVQSVGETVADDE